MYKIFFKIPSPKYGSYSLRFKTNPTFIHYKSWENNWIFYLLIIDDVKIRIKRKKYKNKFKMIIGTEPGHFRELIWRNDFIMIIIIIIKACRQHRVPCLSLSLSRHPSPTVHSSGKLIHNWCKSLLAGQRWCIHVLESIWVDLDLLTPQHFSLNLPVVLRRVTTQKYQNFNMKEFKWQSGPSTIVWLHLLHFNKTS